MALPALTKTWEFRTNEVALGASNAAACESVAFQIKQMLTDTIANGWQNGTWVDVGGGNFEIQGITDDVVDVSMVGKTLKVRGDAAGNNGDHVITAIPTSDSIRINNGSGVAGAVTGSWNVLGGNFTTPWVMQHSMNFSMVPGTRDDEVDRLGVSTDCNVGFDNGGYFVLKNTVTGTEWAWSGTRQNGGDNAAWVSHAAFPNYFDPWTGGTSTVSFPQPNAINDFDGVGTGNVVWRNKADWLTASNSAFVAKVHVMITDDGENTRVMVSQFGVIPLYWFDETVQNPHPGWFSTYSNATVTGMRNSAATSNVAGYGTLNDAIAGYSSVIPASAISPLEKNKLGLYFSSEGAISSMNGQLLTVANELSGEWGMFPVGLVGTSVGHRVRAGQIPDLWWCSDGLTAGQTFPSNTSRQFLVIEDLVVPWDGSLPELS